MADTKVKIQSSVLLAALKKHRTQMDADYKKANEKYERDDAKWLQSAKAAVEKALTADISKLKTGGYRGRWTLEIPLPSDRPGKPARPNFDAIDREIKLLEAAEDQVLTINSDDSRVRWL